MTAFPCLALAKQAIMQPGGMCVFSAANEVAVAAFLAREIRFTEIDVVIANALEAVNLSEPQSLDAVKTLDKEARSAAAEAIAKIASVSERQEKEL
jgi:1-deoxy-D-xylulose-5-phosphate reductoisomerase